MDTSTRESAYKLSVGGREGEEAVWRHVCRRDSNVRMFLEKQDFRVYINFNCLRTGSTMMNVQVS